MMMPPYPPAPTPTHLKPTVPPADMEAHHRTRVRAAAHRATRLYPDPIGELLARELATWADFGYRLGTGSLVLRAADHILKATSPPPGTP